METIVQIFPDVAIAIADASPDLATLQKGSDPVAFGDAIRRVTGDMPALRIDLTDPPMQAVAIVGPYQATGADADGAMKALGAALSTQIAAVPAPVQVSETAPVTP